MEWRQGDYVVTDEKAKVDVDRVHQLLSATYWAAARSRETVQKTVDHSLCFSVLYNGVQVGADLTIADGLANTYHGLISGGGNSVQSFFAEAA